MAKKEAVGTKREFAIYLALVIGLGILLAFFLEDMAQTLATTIFLAIVIGTLMFWQLRVAIAFIGIVLLLVAGTLDLPHAIEYMNMDVILFLVGMMVIIGLLRQSGFFRWLLVEILKVSRFKPRWLIIMVMVLASVMAAMVDEVTSILFISALVLDLCDYFGVNPVKYVIAVILATNIGSSWTVLGNPIGILIALRSGLTFTDFIRSALPVGVVSLLLLIPVVLLWLRKDLELLRKHISYKEEGSMADVLYEWAKVKDKGLFVGSIIIFAIVVILLAVDHRLELWLGLGANTLLFATPILGAGIVMLWQRGHAQEYIQRDVDWWALVFFMFLFATAGTLKQVGLTDDMANAMSRLSSGYSPNVLSVATLWLSGLLSAVVDNVVAVAGLIPVAQTLSAESGTSSLWWALLFGGCYGGNLTMVGSTANIVALGLLEKRAGHYSHHITLKQWITIGFWAFLIPMIIATVALILYG
ncbi:SLC13 family permease [Chloroflexota bacterium]